jgi:hypothetical protein
MFVLDDDLAVWDAQLAHLHGVARLNVLAQLAWHQRQRSPARARGLAHEAAPLVAQLADSERRRVGARFTLIEGEARWLVGELDAARALADQALRAFDALDDATGSADAYWLRAWRCGSTCSTPPPRCSRCSATSTPPTPAGATASTPPPKASIRPRAAGSTTISAPPPSRPATSGAPSAF